MSGAVLFDMQKSREALACFAAARALAGDGGHGAVADDNSQIIRSRKGGFLSRPLTTSRLRAEQEKQKISHVEEEDDERRERRKREKREETESLGLGILEDAEAEGNGDANRPECWVKMPTGCDKPLAETKTPLEWFRDQSGRTDAAGCASRKGGYDKWCHRNDAQLEWTSKGAHNAPSTEGRKSHAVASDVGGFKGGVAQGKQERGNAGSRRHSLAHRLGEHVANFSCPAELIEDKKLQRAPMSLTNLGTDVLYPAGRIGEALACFQEAMDVMNSCPETGESGVPCSVSAHVRSAVMSNYNTMMDVLRPGNKGARVFHNIGGRRAELPDHMEPSHVPGAPDETILVWDDALTEAQCTNIIEVFEDSDHYVGNLVSNGKIVVDHKHKKASEFEVASGAVKDPRWAAIEMQLLSILIKTALDFEKKNPIIKQLKNPLGDEGFRIKRYVDDGTEHHAYHADSGQEAPCAPRRVLAILLYFNSVEEGGETAFLQQGIRVMPKCGRVVMFPTAFTHVHAGLPPRKGIKYNAVNFLTIQ